MTSATAPVVLGDLPAGFDGISRLRYLFAGRASKVTPSGRLQSCIVVVLVDAVLVCSHRGGVHRYLPIESIRSLTTFPRGWLLLNCSGPVPGATSVVEPSKVHDVMLVLSVPQRLVDVLQRVRAARSGSTLPVSNSDQIPSLADFRLRPLESAPTRAPLRMWALAAAANTQNALDTLSAQLVHRDAPGLHLVANKVPRRAGIRHATERVGGAEVARVRARGPPFPYAPCDWLTGFHLGSVIEHATSHLIMAVARFVPTREQQLAASGEGGPTNGTASVIFPVHYQVAAVLCFAHARLPQAAVSRGSYDAPSVTLRFLAPRSTIETLRTLSAPSRADRPDAASLQAPGGEAAGQMRPLRIAESLMLCVMQKYAERVAHIVSVQRQILSITGVATSMPPVNTEGGMFWRNPRVALFGDASAMPTAGPAARRD
jgi:hypothetical protein